MNTRELLELAAKAAGLIPSEFKGNKNYMDGVLDWWNPLEDDGDALRLAVITGVLRGRGFDNAWAAMYAVGKLPEDRVEATRRAIVRAAAEIGRAIP